MNKLLLRGLLIIAFAVIGTATYGNQSASALGNWGYFDPNLWACAWSPSNARDCGSMSAYYENDVVPGRSGGATRAIPDYAGASKNAYRDWVIGEYNSGNNDRKAAARFIIATMLGGSSESDNLAEFSSRMGNTNLTMERVTNGNPNDYGNISYRGTTIYGDLDFFWEPLRPGTVGNLFLFYVTGNPNPVYVIQQNCGNPVGLPNIPGLPEPEDWSLSAGAKVKASSNPTPFSALPNGGTINGSIGQSYTWELWLRNDGPTGMTARGASYVGERTGYSDPNWNNNFAIGRYPTVNDESARNGPGGYLYGSWFSPGPAQQFETYTIRAADVGRTLCQHMAAYPRSSSSNTWLNSAPACVYVPYNYSLIPSLSVSTTSVESADTPFTVSSAVDHSGTPSRDTDWRIVKLIFNSTAPDPSGTGAGRSNNTPCAYFAGATNCDAAWWQSTPNPIVFNGDQTQSTGATLGGDFSMANRVCYAAAVSRPTHDPADPAWEYSSLRCVLASKRPKAQFWGSDIRSGDAVRTNRTVAGPGGTRMFGAWAEYGILAQGVVASSSGGGLSSDGGGRPLSVNAMDYNQLTFANTPNFGNFGLISESVLSTILTSSSGSNVTSGTRSIADLTSAAGTLNRWTSPSLNISGGTVPAGKTLIIQSTGTVTISGNVLYQMGSYGSTQDLPQMVIIAQNIVIDASVGEVNGWLVAKSNANSFVSTCGSVASPATWLNGLNATACNNRLRINGPIIANHLYLRRTFGSEVGGLHEPSEVINLRPDTYLWAHNLANSSGSIKTGYVRELPPRF